jgi:ribosomal protein S17E
MQNIDILINKYLKELSLSYKDFDKNKDIINKACDVAKLAHE